MEQATTESSRVGGRDYLVAVPLDPERDRDGWLADRLKGYGGSDAAAIAGETGGSYGRRGIDVWAERLGDPGAAQDEDSDRTVMGRRLESLVLEMVDDGEWPEAPRDVFVVKPPTVYHRDRPWQRGSADGLLYEPEQAAGVVRSSDGEVWARPALLRSPCVPGAGLEVKTHGYHAARAYGDAEDGGEAHGVPADKRIQCAWYMELYDLPVWYLAVLSDTHKRQTFAIPRDRELGDYLLEEVQDFDRKYVRTRTPPPPDGSARYGEYLKRRFRVHDAEVVGSDEAVDQAVAEWLDLKVKIKASVDRKEALEAVIKSRIGDHLGVRSEYGLVTWKSQASGKLRDKEARTDLYHRLGMTDAEVAEFEAKYAQPDHRVMRHSVARGGRR